MLIFTDPTGRVPFPRSYCDESGNWWRPCPECGEVFGLGNAYAIHYRTIHGTGCGRTDVEEVERMREEDACELRQRAAPVVIARGPGVTVTVRAASPPCGCPPAQRERGCEACNFTGLMPGSAAP